MLNKKFVLFKTSFTFLNVNAIYYVFFITCMHLYDRNYIYLGDHEIKNETPGKKMYPDKKKLIICQSKAYIYCMLMAK